MQRVMEHLGFSLHVSLRVAVFRNKDPDCFTWVNDSIMQRLCLLLLL